MDGSSVYIFLYKWAMASTAMLVDLLESQLLPAWGCDYSMSEDTIQPEVEMPQPVQKTSKHPKRGFIWG